MPISETGKVLLPQLGTAARSTFNGSTLNESEHVLVTCISANQMRMIFSPGTLCRCVANTNDFFLSGN